MMLFMLIESQEAGRSELRKLDFDPKIGLDGLDVFFGWIWTPLPPDVQRGQVAGGPCEIQGP